MFPPYLAQVLGGSFDLVLWMIVATIGGLPWAIKAIVGPLSDKFGSKKYGNRLPWITSFGGLGGAFWLMMAFYLPLDQTIYIFFAFYYFFTQVGTAFSDTVLDSLILDVTPKEELGKVQGVTWTFMFLGQGAGGMLLGLIFLALNLIPLLFMMTGILMVIASLLPYFVAEEPFEKISNKAMAKDVISIISKFRNYKVFAYVFLGAIIANVIVFYLNYVILIAMGVIDVTETILSITSGSAVDLLGWSSVFLFCYGLGTVIGSLITGKYTDKQRKRTILKAFLIYIPISLVCVVPFVIFNGVFIVALIFGVILQIIIGAAQGALTVSNQTVRGDLTRNYYPNLKSTYYALLIALNNLGQTVGTWLSAIVFNSLAGVIPNFYLIYFIIMSLCAGSLTTSMLLFRSINSKDYEFIGEDTSDEVLE